MVLLLLLALLLVSLLLLCILYTTTSFEYILLFHILYFIFSLYTLNLFYNVLILGTNINLRTAIQQKTPLMIALEHNQLDTMLMLLRCGAMMSLELVDVNGWTPLHYAACYGRIELAMVRVVGVVAVVVVNSSVLLQCIVVVEVV